ncbi:DUF2182 domain-containing protein [Mesorhizobium sp. KR2-14]
MNGKPEGFDHLDRTGRATGHVAQNPRTVVYAMLGVGILLSWALLALMALRGAEIRGPGSEAPGDELLRMLPPVPVPAFLDRFFSLCLNPLPPGGLAPDLFAALTLMWFLMSVAMMLPSAAPMIRTYCEIADTAGRKREAAVHPLILVAGYLCAWLAASALFAALTILVHRFAAGIQTAPVKGVAGALALGLAGLYQFTGFKDACLNKCRNPFSILFARWSPRPLRIFRLGVEQGLWCLGCCWALMLVMFAVGIMNLFWMALIAVFTLVEKQGTRHVSTRLAGAILLVWAVALLLSSA